MADGTSPSRVIASHRAVSTQRNFILKVIEPPDAIVNNVLELTPVVSLSCFSGDTGA